MKRKSILVAPVLAILLNTSLSAEQFSISNLSLKQAIEEISKKSNMPYMVDGKLLDGKKAPNIKNIEGVENALNEILKDTNLKATIEDGTILIREKAIGQGTVLEPISVNEKSLNTTEETGSYTLGSINTATKLNMSLKETPQSLSVITKQRIEDQGLKSITEVLEQTPGISVQSLGTNRYAILSRGGYPISSYQFDGIPTYSDSGTQNVSQGLVDTAIYDHIEVLRGATGLTTGAGEPSGTINMVRKKPTKDFQANVEGTIGSWDLYRTMLDVSSALNEDGSIRGRMVSSYQTNESFRDYLEKEKKVFYGVVEADITDTTLLRVGVDYQDNNIKGGAGQGFILFYDDGSRTNFSRSHNYSAKWSNENIKAYNTFATIEQDLKNEWKLKTSINYMKGDKDWTSAEASWGFFNKYTGDGIRLYGGEGEAEQTQKGFDTSIDGPFKLFGREHQFIGGFSYSKYHNTHMPFDDISGVEGRSINYYTWGNDTSKPINNGKLYDWNSIITQKGTYLATRLNPIDDLSLIVGARFSKYENDDSWEWMPSLSSNNSKTNFDEKATTPYAGIVYDLTDEHSIYASYTSIFQPQNNRDRNGNMLDPREGNNYEIGYKNELFGGSLNSSIALYRLNQDKLAVADGGYFIPGTTTGASKAINGTQTEGIDIEITGELIEDMNIQASYTYSQTKDQNDNRIRTIYPKHIAKIWTTYKLDKLTLGGGTNWQSKMFMDTESWQLPNTRLYAEQKSYITVNLMAKYDFSKNLSGQLNINNIFDKKYLSSLDDVFYTGDYGDPMNASLTLKYKF
ncbi:TonB-dependent siderophore receptor [Aliarcobacter butzleri]|uniref:TonB-dependent siderophore receptor n=1 Tax=Aliarcobacter butzleri TaxID=28197 RepID=UPI003AC087A5